MIYQSEAPDPNEPVIRRVLEGAGAALEDTVGYRLPAETRSRYLAILRGER